MTEIVAGHFRLSGYVPVNDNGFALPAYSAYPGANAWYVAAPKIDGDHASPISHFELLEDEDVLPLPETGIEVSTGDPWQDVFLWNGRTYAGTPHQILHGVEEARDDLEASIPISFLDLLLAAEAPLAAQISESVLSFLRTRLGNELGADIFQETVLRPGVLLELRRNFHRHNQKHELGSFFYSFAVLENTPGSFHIKLAAGTAAMVDGHLAATELDASIRRLGDLLGISICLIDLPARSDQAHTGPEIGQVVPYPASYLPAEQIDTTQRLPNILVIAADQRAAKIARYLEPPIEVAFDSGSIWGENHYRIQTKIEAGRTSPNPAVPTIHVVEQMSKGIPLKGFAVVVWLAGNEALTDYNATAILAALRGMDEEIPLLIAPAPPAEGPSTLLTGDWGGASLLKRCNAIIDTTLARSPFWAGQPRRSIDRRMADIIANASVVATLNGKFREALFEARGSQKPYALSFFSGLRKFEGDNATTSELNVAGANKHDRSAGRHTRVAFELRERSMKRYHNGFLELQPLRQDFALFAEMAVIQELRSDESRTYQISSSHDIPSSISRVLDNPELATTVKGLGKNNGLVIVTAETPNLTSLRAADGFGERIVRYTDFETLRALDNDQARELPSEIRLPDLHRYPQNRGLATRGVDTRDVIRLPEDQWRAMQNRHVKSALDGQERRYAAALGMRDADPEIALPVPAVWDAINVGDRLAQDLREHFPRLGDERMISGKRTGDLVAAWSRPARGAWRWIVEDGRIPVQMTRLEPDEVPAQRLFFIDGDNAVPIFLMSRIFAVWARALLPSSTSWASRFQVSKTFDAFPFSLSFEILPSENGSPPRLQLARNGTAYSKLAELTGDDADQLAKVAQEFGHDEQALRNHPVMRQIDALLLDDIHLSAKSSDLDILENLIERNNRFL